MSESEPKTHFQRIEDLPLVVCVIEGDDGLLGVGFSMAHPTRFREEYARQIAHLNATQCLDTLHRRRRGEA